MPKDILAARSSPPVTRSNSSTNMAGLSAGVLYISAPEDCIALITPLLGNCQVFPMAILLKAGSTPTTTNLDAILLPIAGSEYFHSCPAVQIGLPAGTTTIRWLAITNNLATLTFNAGDTALLVASITY